MQALASRLGADTPQTDPNDFEEVLVHLERATDHDEAVAEATPRPSDSRALDTLPQAVLVTDDRGETVFRNSKAVALIGSRHGDTLTAQAVEELLAATAPGAHEERVLELYGPPRRTLVVRAESIDNGQRALGVIAVIEDVSERRRLEDVRRDFVANVSHELKTPMGAVGLRPRPCSPRTSRKWPSASHIGSTTRPFASAESSTTFSISPGSRTRSHLHREPVLINLVMAEAAEQLPGGGKSATDRSHARRAGPTR